MPDKVCPRCGMQYEDLRSTTCPQCFARLVAVDEETASELKTARAEIELSPEFRRAKEEDDERYRQQSFGACLGIVVIALSTLIIAVILISAAVRHSRSASGQRFQSASAAHRAPAAGSLDLLTTLPVAAASLGDVLPATVGPYRRVRADQQITLSGTLVPVFHATYTGGSLTIDAYAIPASLPTPEEDQFRQGIELAAQMEADNLSQTASVPTQTFATEHWRYATIGPAHTGPAKAAALDSFRMALGIYFHALSG